MVSLIFSYSYIQRLTNPAITAPMIGATQKSQSWPIYSPPANSAGPVLRAGLTEVLVTGIETRWIKVRASPIGTTAKPVAARFDVVPMMTNRHTNVITTSSTNQLPRPYSRRRRPPQRVALAPRHVALQSVPPDVNLLEHTS